MGGFEAKKPDYSGDGIAVWKAIVENGKNKGKEYLKVRVLGGKSINCFQVEEKERPEN